MPRWIFLSLALTLVAILAPGTSRAADDLDVTIRMIDRRSANVDRFMNRIELPRAADAAANRRGVPDRSSDDKGDDSAESPGTSRQTGADDSSRRRPGRDLTEGRLQDPPEASELRDTTNVSRDAVSNSRDAINSSRDARQNTQDAREYERDHKN
jgi:hypothetical protein